MEDHLLGQGRQRASIVVIEDQVEIAGEEAMEPMSPMSAAPPEAGDGDEDDDDEDDEDVPIPDIGRRLSLAACESNKEQVRLSILAMQRDAGGQVPEE
jgi:hypothetical protein